MSGSKTDEALQAVYRERQRQDAKWGLQRHQWPEWMAVLGEEYGEACQEVCRVRWGSDQLPPLREELIHVAAVAVAIIEHLDEEIQAIKDAMFDPERLKR